MGSGMDRLTKIAGSKSGMNRLMAIAGGTSDGAGAVQESTAPAVHPLPLPKKLPTYRPVLDSMADGAMPLSPFARKKLDLSAQKQNAFSTKRVPGKFGGEEKPNVGTYAKANWDAAADGISKGLASTYDFLLPTELLVGEEKDPLSKLKNHFTQREAENTEKANEIGARMGPAWKKAGETIVRPTMAAIPNAVMALLTGGTATAAQTGAALTGAAGTGLAATITSVGSGILKNPSFWTSFAQTTGPAYEKAKAEGAGEIAATASAMITGLLNSTVEVSGGIETLPGKMAGDTGESAVRNWVTSMLDEGKEEVVQGYIQALSEKVTYAHQRPNFSLTDQNAVVNPARAGQEFMGGAMVGGILGGAEMGISKAIQSLPVAVQKAPNEPVLPPIAGGEQQVQNGPQNTSPVVETVDSKTPDYRPDFVQEPPAVDAKVEALAEDRKAAPEDVPVQNNDEIHIDERTWVDVGKRKVKAFQYDHPELHGYFAKAAKEMNNDLAGTIRGKRYPIMDFQGYIVDYTGDKRATSSTMETALDTVHLTYAQISKALDDLIEDHGQENYAAAKKVELILDTRLTEGYTDMEGMYWGPDEDYIAAKNSLKQGAEPENHDYSMSEDEWNALMETEDSAGPNDGNIPGDYEDGNTVGAMKGRYPNQQKQSKVGSNTFTGMYADVLAQMEQDGGNVTDLPYDVITEKQSMERANQRLQLDLEGEIADLPNHEEWSSEDVDAAMGIMDRYVSEARESHDYRKANEWAKLIRRKGTKGGQMIQAFAKYTRTPQGILVRAAETLDKAGVTGKKLDSIMDSVAVFSGMLDDMKQKNSNDPSMLVDIIKAQAHERKTNVSKTTEKALMAQDTKYLYDFALTQLENIALDYEKVSAGQKISTYQAFSHLFNAKTALRNLVSNQFFDIVDEAANNISLIPDAIIGVMTGQRTVGAQKSWFSKEKRHGAAQGARKGWAEVSLDVDMGQATKYGTGGRRTNKMVGGKASKVMSTAEKALGFELNVTDEFHKGSVEAEVLESLTKAVARGDMTQEEAEGFAKQEALYRSFQDDTIPGAALAKLKDVMNLIGIGDSGKKIKGKTVHQFGLGDFVQKYTQVPGALMSRAVEFSPAGYGKAIIAMAKAAKQGGIDTAAQRKAALAIGRATTGTGLAVAFAALASAGLLSRADDEDDKDIAALNASEGISGTQLNMSGLTRWVSGGDPKRQTGDLLISADFLEPINALMTVGALMGTENRGLLDATFEGTYEAILDTPTMKSFRTLYDTNRYHDPEGDLPLYLEIPIEIAKGSASGFVPGLVRQTAQVLDPTYRDTYTSQDPGQQTVDALKNSIPGLRQTLPVKKTPFGEDKTDKDGIIQRIGNAYLLPGAMKTYRQSPVSKELDAVRKETGSGTIYPDRNPPNRVKYAGEDYSLTPEERTEYQERRGTVTYDLMQSMMDGDAYAKGSPEEKAKMLDDVTSYANDLAKREVLAGRGVDYQSSSWEKAYKITEAGIPFDLYLEYKGELSDLKADGKASEANSAVRRAIFRDSRLSKAQKGLLDETILSDGIYLPKDVNVDYGDAETFAVTQMSEAAQKRYPDAKKAFGLEPDAFSQAWGIYNESGVKKPEKLKKLRDLGLDATEAIRLYALFGK